MIAFIELSPQVLDEYGSIVAIVALALLAILIVLPIRR